MAEQTAVDPGTDAPHEPPPAAPLPDETTPSAGPTLAESADDRSVAAPADWPADWREKIAGEDTKFLGRLKRFASPQNFGKAWVNAQDLVSQKGPKRPEGDDPEALASWRVEMGLPDTPEGYLQDMPEGLIIGDDDKEIAKEFLESMHADDVPPSTVHKTMKWYHGEQARQAEAIVEMDRVRRAGVEDELRQEWGNEYSANLGGVHSLFDTHAASGLRERFFAARFADGTPFGDDPDALRFLTAISNDINPQGTITPAAGQGVPQAIDDEIAGLEAEMKDAKGKESGGYWNSEAKRKRYLDLTVLRDKMKARG